MPDLKVKGVNVDSARDAYSSHRNIKKEPITGRVQKSTTRVNTTGIYSHGNDASILYSDRKDVPKTLL